MTSAAGLVDWADAVDERGDLARSIDPRGGAERRVVWMRAEGRPVARQSDMIVEALDHVDAAVITGGAMTDAAAMLDAPAARFDTADGFWAAVAQLAAARMTEEDAPPVLDCRCGGCGVLDGGCGRAAQVLVVVGDSGRDMTLAPPPLGWQPPEGCSTMPLVEQRGLMLREFAALLARPRADGRAVSRNARVVVCCLGNVLGDDLDDSDDGGASAGLDTGGVFDGAHPAAVGFDDGRRLLAALVQHLGEHGMGWRLESTPGQQAVSAYRHRWAGVERRRRRGRLTLPGWHRVREVHELERRCVREVLGPYKKTTAPAGERFEQVWNADYRAFYPWVMTGLLPYRLDNYFPAGLPVDELRPRIDRGDKLICVVRVRDGGGGRLLALPTPDLVQLLDRGRTQAQAVGGADGHVTVGPIVEVVEAASYTSAAWAAEFMGLMFRFRESAPPGVRLAAKIAANALWSGLSRTAGPEVRYPGPVCWSEDLGVESVRGGSSRLPVRGWAAPVARWLRAGAGHRVSGRFEIDPECPLGLGVVLLAADIDRWQEGRLSALQPHVLAEGRRRMSSTVRRLDAAGVGVLAADTDGVWTVERPPVELFYEDGRPPPAGALGGVKFEDQSGVEWIGGGRYIDGRRDAHPGLPRSSVMTRWDYDTRPWMELPGVTDGVLPAGLARRRLRAAGLPGVWPADVLAALGAAAAELRGLPELTEVMLDELDVSSGCRVAGRPDGGGGVEC